MQELKPGKDYIGTSVFCLVSDEHNRILLGLNKKSEKKGKDYENVWSMPGGTIEFGETAVRALKREIKEETNLDIHDVVFVNYNDYIKKDEQKHWLALNFTAKASSLDLANLEEDKFERLEFFDRDQIPDNISKFAREFIKRSII